MTIERKELQGQPFETAAKRIADEIIRYQWVLLDKTGHIEEPAFHSILDTMQEKSLLGLYPIDENTVARFWVFHMGTVRLKLLAGEETYEKPYNNLFFDQMVQYASKDPGLVKTITDDVESDIRWRFTHETETFGVKVVQAIQRIIQVQPADAQSRLHIIPVFNIHFSIPLLPDPESFYNGINNGKIPVDSLNTNDMDTLIGSYNLVRLVDGLLYQPQCSFLIAAPLIPYTHVILKRTGHEKWMGPMAMPNEDYAQAFRRAQYSAL